MDKGAIVHIFDEQEELSFEVFTNWMQSRMAYD